MVISVDDDPRLVPRRTEMISPAYAGTIDAAYALVPDGEAVVFLRDETLAIVDPVDTVLGSLPWSAMDTLEAERLLDLVDESSHEQVQAAFSRAGVTTTARTAAVTRSGHVCQVSIMCFGSEAEVAVAVFDRDASLTEAVVSKFNGFRTRITCTRQGDFVDAEGELGSFADLGADLGLWGDRVVLLADRPQLYHCVQTVLDGEPYARTQVRGAAPGLHFDVVVCTSGEHLIVDLHDDSQRLDTVTALTRSQAQFDRLSETLPVGVFVVGSEGRFEFHSERLREMFGASVASEFGWIENIHLDDRPLLEAALNELPERRSFNVELRCHRPDGEIGWFRLAGRDLRGDDGVLKCVVGFVEDISERRNLHQKIEYQASFDGLTALPNRTTLVAELRSRLDQQRPGASTGVLFIDLDGFKLINDTQGHSVGDAVLLEVAQRFRRAIRPKDVIGRFGGDEFVVVASDLADPEEALGIARRLHDILSTPVLADGRIISVNASIGIALCDAGSSTSDQLIGDADIAMYEAKANGRNRSVVFDAPLRSRASQRFDMTADLRHARRRRELRLEYQPIIDLETDKLIGAEGLVRWDHPALGRISPAVFIPLAEEIGLIDDVGEWVVEQACADLDRMRCQSLIDDDFVVSINASAQQFNNVAMLATSSLASLDQFGLTPKNLRFELTESVPLSQIPEAATRIRQLTSYGFGLAIDDFGTGYSSLGYLTMLPFDVLKLDLSLIAQLEDGSPALAVVDSLTRMAAEMKFTIVAEGIETADQKRLLRSAGVQLGQGYYISRPLALPDLATLISNDS